MKIVGLIAEYNPFHNGHQFHLEMAKKQTGADFVIVVMSGDYMQRGTPAIFSKYMRTKCALSSGADLVLEMPVFGSVASAPDFARCGVETLAHTGVCNFLCFGSESGDLELLRQQAFALSDESDEISEHIRANLRRGLTWPQARAVAYAQSQPLSASPNDILGIEYLRSLEESTSSIEPIAIRRTDPGYHSEERFGTFASATAARKAILEHDMDFLQTILPDALFDCLNAEKCPPITFDDFSLLLNEKMLRMELDELKQIAGMPTDLAQKLFRERLNFHPADKMVQERKDRQYTYTRINRCLMNLILGITKEEEALFKSYNASPWLRILGFRKDAAPLLTAMKQNAKAPMLTKTANAPKLLSDPTLTLFQKHVQSAELYRLVSQMKNGKITKNEYTRGVILL